MWTISKTLKLIVAIISIGLAFLAVLACVFLPTYFLLPSEVRSITYHTSKSIASVFRNFSELQLEHGITCNQNKSVCINSLILTGELSVGDEKRFQDLFQDLQTKHPNTKTVCFNSPGRYTSAAAIIARQIKLSNFNTCVGDWSIGDSQANLHHPRYTSRCVSACTMLMLAGSRRIAIGDRFLIGFHSPKTIIEATDPGKEKNNRKINPISKSSTWGVYMTPLAYSDIVESYKDALSVSSDEMEAILTEMSFTPNSKMYFPSIQQLMEMRFFNQKM